MAKYHGNSIRKELLFLVNNVSSEFTDVSNLEDIISKIANQCGVSADDIKLAVETSTDEKTGEEEVTDIYLGCPDPNPEKDDIVNVRDVITRENIEGQMSGGTGYERSNDGFTSPRPDDMSK